jgi:hypothetical protein
MAILDSLNFEDADIDTLCTASNFTKGGTPTLSTTQKHSGNQSLYIVQPGLQDQSILKQYVTYFPSRRTLYYRFWFYMVNLPIYGGSEIGLFIGNDYTGDSYGISINQDAKIYAWTKYITRFTTTGTVSAGQWYELFFMVNMVGSGISCEMKVLGETLQDSTAMTDYLNIQWIGSFYSQTQGYNVSYYMDDFEINDSEYPPSLASSPVSYYNLQFNDKVILGDYRNT